MNELRPVQCVLCHRPLTPESRTEEHIIPRSLGNRSYVVRWTCAECNHIMAHSFENDVVRRGNLKDVYESVLAPDSESWVEGRGFELDGEHVRVQRRDGELAIVGAPKPVEKTQTIPVPLKGRDGKNYTYHLMLPEPFPRSVRGSRDAVEKHIDRAIDRVQQYWLKLRDEPSKDPNFAAFVEQHGIDLGKQNYLDSPLFNFGFDESASEPNHVRLPPQEHSIYFADAMRFFGKIAWMHTYKQLGPDAVQNPAAKAIANYLRFVEVRPKITDWLDMTGYEHQVLDEWIRVVPFNSRLVRLWSAWPEQILEALSTCSLPANLVDEIRTSSYQRIQSRRQMTKLFLGSEQVLVRTQDLHQNTDASWHRLEFAAVWRKSSKKEDPRTVCRVQLFGGQIEVGVIIAERLLKFDSHNTKVIDFSSRF